MFEPNDHLMDLKGKKYLQVMWRLVWFRTEKPLWSLDTKLEHLTDKHAVFSAKIYDENGVQKSAGYGSESISDFKDYIEKAETKAVGRALAMLGYGTQFAPELDEGERIVDSPVATNKGGKAKKLICEDCGGEIKAFNAEWPAERVAARNKADYGRTICVECAQKRKGSR